MGKARRHMLRLNKSNPLGFVNSDDIESILFDEETTTNPLEAVRDQLTSANVEEKINGLQSLAVWTSNKAKATSICQSDLVRITAPHLCDSNQAVRNAAAGALRNLSVCGPDVCEYLVEQDVMTPLLALLSEYTGDVTWQPIFDSSMAGQIDLKSDVFLQAINLFWNLCESTSVALDAFNQTPLLEGLVRCLDYKLFGIDIALSVAQCLLVVSENNPKSWLILNQHLAAFIFLLDISGDHGHLYLSTLTAGILSNVPALAAAYAPKILTALSQTLTIDHQVELTSIVKSLQDQEKDGPLSNCLLSSDAMEDESESAAEIRRRKEEMPNDLDVVVRNVENILDAQKIAAEVITNICSPDEEDCDGDDISENEDVLDYETLKNSSNANISDDNKLPVDVVEAIKSMGLIEKLWQRAQQIPDNVMQSLRESSRITLLIKEKNLRISSLICLQNLCNLLTTEDLGGTNSIYNVWVSLGQQVFRAPKDSVLEPITSLMRSVLDHLKNNKELFDHMTKEDLQLMLDGVQNCSMPEIRANWLRMLGTLGCLLSEELAKIIILYILEICGKEEDVWTMSEALDALMDMFENNDWTQVVNEFKLPEIIMQLEKLFKSKMRQQKRELKERYLAVQTVQRNLSRFILYLEK